MKTIRLLSDILFLGFMITFIYIFISVYNNRIPNIFGYHFLRVVSSSMTPEIEEGSCIIVKTTDINSLKCGDIITFYSEDPYIYGMLNTHRIVKIEKDENGKKIFKTRGDANAGEDVYGVSGDKIIGVYQGNLIYGWIISKGLMLLSDKIVYFIFVMAPILLCMLSSILSIFRIIFEPEKDSGINEEVNDENKENN